MKNTISNFIPINRKLFKHEFWTEKRPYSRFEAWLDLLVTARFDDSEGRMLIGSTVVRWNRGELVASLRYLADRWGWSKTKVDKFLTMLKLEKMIKTRTADGTVQTVVTICNYEDYNTISKTKGQQAGQYEDSLKTVEGQYEDKTNIDNKEQQSKQREIYRGFAHLVLYTDEYFSLINTGHKKQQIDDTLDAIENFKNNKKYVSLFLTLKNWLARDLVAAPAPNPAKATTGRITNIASAFQEALQYG